MPRALAVFNFALLMLVTTRATWAQDFVWAKQIGGTSVDDATGVALDASGNVYTAGGFNGTADFDPGPATFNLTSAGGRDAFVSKLDSNGTFLWAGRIGGTSSDELRSVALDASGNVYTAGDFRGTADFDPGPATFNLTSAGGFDAFVSKLDSNGNLLWAGRIGGTSSDELLSVAADASGNVYTVGAFQGTADFDPGPGTFNLTSAGDFDAFVTKLDSNGNFLWAGRIGGTVTDEPSSVALDASGNVYTVGFFQGTADFDPGPGTFNLTSAGDFDAFVTKLDSNGNFLWAGRIGGTVTDEPSSVALDASGNVYTVGFFQGTADFDPGPATFNLTSAGIEDVFISKLDSAGNFLWAGRIGGTVADGPGSVALDASGNIYTVGRFDGTADFDPGPGTVNLISAGGIDAFVSKLDSNGNFLLAGRIGGTSVDIATGVALDASGNVYTVGFFRGTADFDPGPGTFNLTSAGLEDVFISKLCTAAPPQEVPSLTLTMSGTDSILSWTSVQTADRYDVVRGSLGVLNSSDGDFASATEECVANDEPGASLLFSGTPAAGEGFWFLVRGANCGGNGTYDEGTELESRDQKILASGHDCP